MQSGEIRLQGGRRAVEVRGEEFYAAVFAGGQEAG